jgi:hypothetical protein
MTFKKYRQSVQVPLTRIESVIETVYLFLDKTTVTARSMLSLLGSLNAEADLIILGRLHMRPLQYLFLDQWMPFADPLDQEIHMSDDFKSHLEWWLNKSVYVKGVPLYTPTPDLYLFTDASLNGMGGASGTFRPDGSRNMGNQRKLSSHKQSRVESCLSCSDTVCYCCNRQNRTACYRQHDCSVLHSKTRGDTFPTIVSGDLESSQLVSVNVNSTTSKTCARETQCFSRRFVPSEQDFTCGMDTETRDSSNPISVVRNSDGRSVCNQTKSSSTTVCVANTRPSSLGSRCAISKLEPTVRVRFSTVQSDSGSTRKNSTVTPVQNYSNSALLASEIMVQPASELPCGLTDSPSSSGRSVISVSGSSSTHEPRDATSSRLDVTKRSVRENNFSEKVASRIAQSRRTSTRNVYDAKWRVFSYWCKSK